MNKILLSCVFAILLLPVACIKTVDKTFHIHIDECPYTNYIALSNCKNFVSNSEYPLQALIIACQSCNMERLDLTIQNVNTNVYVITITGAHGYASAWIDFYQKTCMVEFHCQDDSYLYPEFIDAFMTEFNSIEHRDVWMEDMMELWEEGL